MNKELWGMQITPCAKITDRGLREGVEGGNLKVFLANVFMASIGSGSNTEVKLKFAHRFREDKRWN